MGNFYPVFHWLKFITENICFYLRKYPFYNVYRHKININFRFDLWNEKFFITSIKKFISLDNIIKQKNCMSVQQIFFNQFKSKKKIYFFILLLKFYELWAVQKIYFATAAHSNQGCSKIFKALEQPWWWCVAANCDPYCYKQLLKKNNFIILFQTPDEYQVEYDIKRKEEDTYVYSRFHGYTYDGIWAMALAIQHVARRIRHFRRNQTVADFRYRDELWEKLFLEALRNTSFEGVTVSRSRSKICTLK